MGRQRSQHDAARARLAHPPLASWRRDPDAPRHAARETPPLSALLDHFREQAAFCTAFGSPFTARLLEAMAGDLAAGGPVAALVGAWPGSPRADVLSLRLAGALHAAALSSRDPALAALYPAARPDAEPSEVWAAARAFLVRDAAWVASFLRWPPQTNEPSRSIALLAGFLELAARFRLPLDILELGASAGINLCWDTASVRTAAWCWGPRDDAAPLETEWRGPPPPQDVVPHVRSRAACDQNPLDLADPEQRLRLRSFIWADQAGRLARFDAAAERALALGVRVERADAADWLEARLARRASDALTVVYHSVFYQYPPRQTRERIAAALAHAGSAGAPLAWLRVEPEAALGGPRDSVRFLIDVITWPGGERRILGVTDGHVRFVEATP